MSMILNTGRKMQIQIRGFVTKAAQFFFPVPQPIPSGERNLDSQDTTVCISNSKRICSFRLTRGKNHIRRVCLILFAKCMEVIT
jgi:hypothetical protein